MIALSLAFVFASGEAQAVNLTTYKTAVSHYDSGNHDHAKRYFHHILRRHPKHWQSHYYIATIHLKKGELTLARKYYNSCVVNYPDVDTCKKIVKALKTIDQLEAKQHLANNPNKDSVIAEDRDNSDEDANLSPEEKKRVALAEKLRKEEYERHHKMVKEIEAKRKEIWQEADKRAQAAIAEGKRELEELRMTTNQFVRSTATGEVFVGVPTYMENKIMGEAHARAKRIREVARLKAKGYRLPTNPHGIDSLSKQLTEGPTKSGTSLHHVGTNLYVRNYVHAKKKEPVESKRIADAGSEDTY